MVKTKRQDSKVGRVKTPRVNSVLPIKTYKRSVAQKRADKIAILSSDDPDKEVEDAISSLEDDFETWRKEFPTLAAYLDGVTASMGGIDLWQWMANQLKNPRVKMADKIALARTLFGAVGSLRPVIERDLARLAPLPVDSEETISRVRVEVSFSDASAESSATAATDRDGCFVDVEHSDA